MTEENQIMQMAILDYGEKSQVDMAIEEMSELTKALLKHRRHIGTVDNIIEEMADVSIMLDQMEMIYGDYREVREAKLRRLEKRLTEE